MNKKYIIRLTEEERKELTGITRTGKHAASKILHAKILLEADAGQFSTQNKNDAQIAIYLGIGTRTVERVRMRCVEEGLESALKRKSRVQNYSSKISGDEEAHLIALCCSEPPEGRSRWTLKLLANQLVELEVMESVSPATVGRALKKTNLNRGRRRNGASLQQ